MEGGTGSRDGRGEGDRVGVERGGGIKGEGEGCKDKEDGKEVEKGQVLERMVLKETDRFQVEGMLEHCVETFGRGLMVDTGVLCP